jgi:hypothetical protein
MKTGLLFLLLFLGMNLYAQKLNENSYRFKDNWVAGANIGFSQFYGDASNSGYFEKFKGQIALTAGLSGRKMFTPALGLGMNFQYSGIKSEKLFNSVGQPVNYALSGSYFDFNVHGYLNFADLFWGYNPDRVFSVYATLGLGVGFWNTTLNDYDSGFVFNSGGSYYGIDYKKAAFVMPFGVGMNFKISKSLAINVEGNLRTVLNDDVDVWRDGFPFDQHFLTTVGVSYYINYGFAVKKKKPCGCDKKAEPEKKMVPIPFYDYNEKTKSEGELQKKSPPVKPVQKKAEVLIPIEDKSTKGIVYRVQILAKRTKLADLALFKKKYAITDDVHENFQDGVYRYSIGYFRNYKDALNYSRIIKSKGVFDAFVVVYKDNVRVPLTSALKK